MTNQTQETGFGLNITEKEFNQLSEASFSFIDMAPYGDGLYMRFIDAECETHQLQISRDDDAPGQFLLGTFNEETAVYEHVLSDSFEMVLSFTKLFK